jgi:MoaA/NifB/PqqE/SkfB family radical SAM enzyme
MSRSPATSRSGILSWPFALRNAFNLVLRGRFDFAFDRMPLRAEHVPPRKAWNLLRIAGNRVLGLSPALGYPYMAHISPSGLCDLRCPLCPANDKKTRGRSLLPFKTYRKFIDETGDYLLYVILWSWGEPLLNPDFVRMCDYARERNILTVTSSNLNRLTKARAEDLVRSGPDALIIALDGLTDRTHGRLRPGGSARRVIANTRLLVEARARTGSRRPFLNLRMVVSRENEAQTGAFRRLARELGVDMVSFKAFSTRQPGYADPAHDKAFAPTDERFRWYEYGRGYVADARRGRYACRFPWTKPTLFADGRVLVCEFDLLYERPLGDINRQSFKDIWFGPEARAVRRRFGRDRAGLRFCRDCVYDYKRFPGCVVDWEILSR